MKNLLVNRLVFTMLLIIITVSMQIGVLFLMAEVDKFDNTLLLNYEKQIEAFEPQAGMIENTIYLQFEYSGRMVIMSLDFQTGVENIVLINNNGTLKSYLNGVLYQQTNLKRDEFMTNLYGAFDQEFNSQMKIVHEISDCFQISALLDEQKYNEISANPEFKMVKTTQGRYFVN